VPEKVEARTFRIPLGKKKRPLTMEGGKTTPMTRKSDQAASEAATKEGRLRWMR
jgi:hypothetical protein